MNIGLIGCGKVGITLCYFLKKHNRIVGVYDIDKKYEKKALRLLHIKKNTSFQELCKASEILFFATPDDQILKAYKKAQPFIKAKKYVFHFSGLLPSHTFPKKRNMYRASVHPFATFPQILIPPARKKYILFIEGDREAHDVARKIFPQKYFILKKINRKDKAMYHLTGVFSSNLLIGLLSATYELTKKLHWSKKGFYEVVVPLIEETLCNVKKFKLKNALSGPIERGDVEVIKKHVKALKKDRNLLKIYKAISFVILENIAKEKTTREIKKILNE